jgi:hypothetical protein
MIIDRYVERAREAMRRVRSPQSPEIHLREGYHWLCRAQDTGSDRGVSHSYEIGRGWLRSYPETTGYIIPTVLNTWKRFGDDEALSRALEMADWELGIQMPMGAIPALADGEPNVFDTGQVVFGWLGAFEATGREVYLDAATRAGRWLSDVAATAPGWRSSNGSAAGITYLARVAWAMLELARITADEQARDSASAFLRWTLAQEEGRGWFRENCLNNNEQPLLHTIAYTAQGQLESGVIMKDPALVSAAERTARELAGLIRPDGRMAGRFDRTWKPTVPWACLTGMAQICIIWYRLDGMTRDPLFAEAAGRVLHFLMSRQDLTSSNDGLRGGIRGSFPVNGAYCRYRVPNWATKFFLDAILLSQSKDRLLVFRG